MDKLPEEIQPLCVSLLGGDRQSLNQIEQSIRGISEGLAIYDSQILEKEIQVLSRQLDICLLYTSSSPLQDTIFKKRINIYG